MNNEDQDFNEPKTNETTHPETESPIPQKKSDDEIMGEEVLDVAEVAGNIAKGRDNSTAKLKELEAKIVELTNDLQRTRADFENFRRQAEAQKEQYGKTIEEKTVRKILPLIDDFERAVAAQPEVMAPLAKGFAKTLNTLGIDKIDTAAGAEFDPELHFATSVEGNGEKEIIAETLQTGYYYQGEVIRPAFVKVTKK